LVPETVQQAAHEFLDQGARALVCASKFGPKNPELEEGMAAACASLTSCRLDKASYLFGGLNFPRRVASAYLNASIASLYLAFLKNLDKILKGFGLQNIDLKILKSDGGVMDTQNASRLPVLALSAGPTASLLGLWYLYGTNSSADILMIDMGGTSTDLAILSRGKPFFTPQGLTIAGRNTLIRGLLTSSLALGGDTDIEYYQGVFVPLAKRQGPPLALDPQGASKRLPTLTDATNVLGLSQIGDFELSRKAFERYGPPEKMANLAVQAVLERLRTAIMEFLERINLQPVYTISDFLVDWKITPDRAVMLGGPANTLAPLVEKKLGIPVHAPKEAPYANAMGAALAKSTQEAELYANTSNGILTIPTLGVRRKIGNDYNLDKAKQDLINSMGDSSVHVTLAESFNNYGGWRTTSKIIRVKAQSSPGLIEIER
jgi:N-methylhydantoinase A/oxoprolinase/acetone carboxylase beta subunit